MVKCGLWKGGVNLISRLETFYGYCPVQNCETFIEVEYINDLDFNRPNLYRRKTISCEYGSNAAHPCPDFKKCPIYNIVPEKNLF